MAENQLTRLFQVKAGRELQSESFYVFLSKSQNCKVAGPSRLEISK